MADALVLDTSACFALLEDEAGADVVESYLVEAKEGRMVTAKRANMNGDISTLEQKLDAKISRLYGLSKDEIKIVEDADK